MIRIRQPGRPGLVFGGLLIAAVAWQAASQSIYADGWHNAALATASLDQWLADVKRDIPNIEERIGTNQLQAGRDLAALRQAAENEKPAKQPNLDLLRGGGQVHADLTPAQRAALARKAEDCMEVLACMDTRNIFPQEFPDFKLEQIPRYREAARRLLGMMGPAGGQTVATTLRAELMGISRAQGLLPHQEYYRDLLEILRESAGKGDISLQDLSALRQAASGQKPPAQQALAQEVIKALIEAEEADIPALLRWANEASTRTQRVAIYKKVLERLGEASLSDLLLVKANVDDTATQRIAANELENRWSEASVLELLTTLENFDDADVQRTAAAALAELSPRYAEVKDQFAGIWQLAASENKVVAEGVRRQAVNAFLRAPMSECLDWLGKGDQELNKLILAQIKDRIGRADAERKSGYARSALYVLGSKEMNEASRLAAVDLLGRVGDRESAGPLIEMLPTLPREFWPSVGRTLMEITGQDFGPKPGDGVAEVSVAVRKWRAWWEENGK